MDYKNKTVIITGASRGIGRAIALAYGECGANIVVNYVRSEEKAQNLVKELELLGAKAIMVQADVSQFDEAKSLVDEAIRVFGQVDILINNSGITKDQLMLRMKEEDFDQVISVNLKGTWNMCRHITGHFLKKRSGSIVNISSVVGLIGNPGQANYVASKAGIIGLTKSLAKEFGARNVRVNAIAPGFIETEMTNALPEEVKKAYLQQIPLKRFGTSKDIANACLYLTSDLANYVTGQIISVNGGMI